MTKSAIEDYDETASNNTDIGGETNTDATRAIKVDNLFQNLMSHLAKFTGADTLDSAVSSDLGSVPGRYVVVTGTTTITALGTIKDGTMKTVKFSGALTLTHNATSLILPGAANITTSAGDIGEFVSEGSGNWRCTGYTKADGTALVVEGANAYPLGYLYGGEISNNSTDATNDIDFATGSCRDSTDTVNIALPALTKKLDAGWAAGTNQGMRNSGASITDTTYFLYAVAKADGADPDYYAHTSLTVATVLTALQAETGGSSYAYARRIGAIVRASSAIKTFTQYGNGFERRYDWLVPVLDVDASNSGASAVSRTLTVPVGIKVLALFAASWTDASSQSVIRFSSLDSTDAASSITAAPGISLGGTSTSTETSAGHFEIMTNTSAQIRSRSTTTDAGDILRINTLGFVDYL